MNKAGRARRRLNEKCTKDLCSCEKGSWGEEGRRPQEVCPKAAFGGSGWEFEKMKCHQTQTTFGGNSAAVKEGGEQSASLRLPAQAWRRTRGCAESLERMKAATRLQQLATEKERASGVDSSFAQSIALLERIRLIGEGKRTCPMTIPSSQKS